MRGRSRSRSPRRRSPRRNGYGATLSVMDPLEKCGSERLANKQLANRLQKEVANLKTEVSNLTQKLNSATNDAQKLRRVAERCVGLAKTTAKYY